MSDLDNKWLDAEQKHVARGGPVPQKASRRYTLGAIETEYRDAYNKLNALLHRIKIKSLPAKFEISVEDMKTIEEALIILECNLVGAQARRKKK